MSVRTYVARGRHLYTVHVGTKNVFTGKIVQKYKSGITSLAAARTLEREMWKICRYGSSPETMLWKELVDRYFKDWERHLDPKSEHTFSMETLTNKIDVHKHIRHWDKIPISMITRRVIEDELKSQEALGKSAATVKNILKQIKTITKWALHEGFMKLDVTDGVGVKVQTRELEALTTVEVQKLLQEALMRKHPYYKVWLLSVMTGLRRSELAGLKWSDIDWETLTMKVQRQNKPRLGVIEHTKTHRPRLVPINGELLRFLKEEKLQACSEFVITSPGADWDHGTQSKVLRAFCKEIGVTVIRHHDLRATFITELLRRGVPTIKVQRAVGHARLGTTEGYARLSDSDILGVTESLGFKIPVIYGDNVVKLPAGS